MLRNAVVCCAIVLAFDAVTASMARGLHFSYRNFVIPEFAMYAMIGYVLQRRAGFGTPTILPIVIAALVESTAGWWISIEIGAGQRAIDATLTLFTVATAVLTLTAMGAAGMWISYGFKRDSKKSEVA